MTAPSISTTSSTPSRQQVLYLVGCAAPPVNHIRSAIDLAQGRGYDTCLILTPTAAGWLEDDLPELAELTGHPVRSNYKQPTQKDVLPPPDAFLVAPMTINTATKWADGHQDCLAVGLIAEAAGRRVYDGALGLPVRPIIALPYLNAWQAAHHAFDSAVTRLRKMGVQVLLGEGGFAPHVPHTGQGKPDQFPWKLALDALDTAIS